MIKNSISSQSSASHLPERSAVSIPLDVLGCSCMLLMMHTYGFAPLQPTLTAEFGSEIMFLAIPLSALSFALSAISMAAWHRLITLRRSFIISLIFLCAGAFLLSLTPSAATFLFTRVITGLGTGMMLPSALLLASAGRKKNALPRLIMIMFALAAGMTFGPSLGGWLNGILGWRFFYRIIAMLTAVLLVFVFLFGSRSEALHENQYRQINALKVFRTIGKSLHVYAFVFLTAVFHSGVFVWISTYFTSHYQLGEFHIATDLIIFGIPGFVVGYLLYRFRLDLKVVKILYAGFFVVIAGLLVLLANLPLWLAECLLSIISIGFSCTQPLFIGILKRPSTVRPLAIGSGILFAGYGFGPLFMIALLSVNIFVATIFLIFIVLIMSVLSRSVWRSI